MHASPHPRQRMLVVDDEESILFAMREYFTLQGFEVDCAAGEEEAQSLVERFRYAVLVADLRLGIEGHEGLDVVRRLRESQPDTPVIVLTAYGSPQVEREARRRGVDAFLNKPQPLSEVARIVRRVVAPGAGEPCAGGAVGGEDVVGEPAADSDLPSDADLVRRCVEGDGRAWDLLVRRYRKLVFGIATRAGLSPDDAADVFQTVFVAAYENLHLLDRPGSVRYWLATVAQREAWKAKRRSARSVPFGNGDGAEEEEPASPAPQPDEELERVERLALLEAAVERLDGRCRRLVEVLFFGDRAPSYDEAARAAGMPRGSVGPTRGRCLEKLRATLRLLEGHVSVGG